MGANNYLPHFLSPLIFSRSYDYICTFDSAACRDIMLGSLTSSRSCTQHSLQRALLSVRILKFLIEKYLEQNYSETMHCFVSLALVQITFIKRNDGIMRVSNVCAVGRLHVITSAQCSGARAQRAGGGLHSPAPNNCINRPLGLTMIYVPIKYSGTWIIFFIQQDIYIYKN